MDCSRANRRDKPFRAGPVTRESGEAKLTQRQPLVSEMRSGADPATLQMSPSVALAVPGAPVRQIVNEARRKILDG
jgi:hypothetical protein